MICISNLEKKAFSIFNYGNFNLKTSFTQNVFIGFTNGNGFSFTNRFSRNFESNGSPSHISTVLGNTGRIGLFVYDIIFVEQDRCTQWFNNEINTGYIVPTRILNL